MEYLLLIGSITLFIYSFTRLNKDDYSTALLFITLAGLLLRVYTSMDFFLHEWDERYHALVAKNLLENPFTPMLYQLPILDYDYTNWTANHVWVHKQPVPLYAMALSMKLFGLNVIALRLPSIILSTLAIVSTFKIGAFIFNKKVGLIAAFFFSINGLIIEQTAGRVATDHIDVFFFSLVSFSVWALLVHTKTHKFKHLFLGSLFLSLAILTKWLPALIVVPIWLVYLYKTKSNLSIIRDLGFLSIITIALVYPWQWYILHFFNQEAVWEFRDHRNHIFEVLGSHSHPWYYHFLRMTRIFGELIYLPVIYLFYKLKKSFKPHFLLLLWVLIPYIFFSIVKTKMQGYILFTAPAIFTAAGVFLYDMSQFKISKHLKYFIACTFIALSVRYSIERIKPFEERSSRGELTTELMSLQNQFDQQKVVIFNTKFPIEIMFYTDFVAYYEIPSLSKIDSLVQDGWQIIIDNTNEIKQEEIKQFPSISLSHY